MRIIIASLLFFHCFLLVIDGSIGQVRETATLQGIISDCYGNLVEGAAVTVEGFDPVYSDSTGFYSRIVHEGVYDVEVNAENYLGFQYYNLSISGTTTLDVMLEDAIIGIGTNLINLELLPDQIISENVDITNEGCGAAGFSAGMYYLEPPPPPYWMGYFAPLGFTLYPGQFMTISFQVNTTGLLPGPYEAAIVISCSEMNSSEQVMIHLDVLVGIPETGADPFVDLFPNPASAFIFIEPRGKDGTIEILNSTGRSLLICPVYSHQKKPLDLSHLPEGIYFVRRFVDERLVSVKKLVVMH